MSLGLQGCRSWNIVSKLAILTSVSLLVKLSWFKLFMVHRILVKGKTEKVAKNQKIRQRQRSGVVIIVMVYFLKIQEKFRRVDSVLGFWPILGLEVLTKPLSQWCRSLTSLLLAFSSRTNCSWSNSDLHTMQSHAEHIWDISLLTQQNCSRLHGKCFTGLFYAPVQALCTELEQVAFSCQQNFSK